VHIINAYGILGSVANQLSATNLND
jgi:hypothetical protein